MTWTFSGIYDICCDMRCVLWFIIIWQELNQLNIMSIINYMNNSTCIFDCITLCSECWMLNVRCIMKMSKAIVPRNCSIHSCDFNGISGAVRQWKDGNGYYVVIFVILMIIICNIISIN